MKSYDELKAEMENIQQQMAEDEESIAALERTVAKRKSYSFSDAHVNVGDVLCYSKDEKITAIILEDNCLIGLSLNKLLDLFLSPRRYNLHG